MSCMRSSRAPFLADNKLLSREGVGQEGRRGTEVGEGGWRGSTREAKNNDCLSAMHARVHIFCVSVCMLLKIEPGISRALFIAAKNF